VFTCAFEQLSPASPDGAGDPRSSRSDDTAADAAQDHLHRDEDDEFVNGDLIVADWDPVEPDLHERQVVALLRCVREIRRTPVPATAAAVPSLVPHPVRVLDLGCGNGRMLIPLVTAGGCHGVGVDEDPDAIVATRHNLLDAGLDEADIGVVRLDASGVQHRIHPHAGLRDRELEARVILFEASIDRFLTHHTAHSGPSPAETDRTFASGLDPFDLVLCVGYTWMLFADPLDALGILTRLHGLLRAPVPPTVRPSDKVPNGDAGPTDHTGRPAFIIDDIPAEFWPRLVDGDWISGVSDDSQSQLVWDRADNVFVLRDGLRVNPDSEAPQPGETRFRLWTTGELRLLADAAGFEPPKVDTEGHLISFVARTLHA